MAERNWFRVTDLKEYTFCPRVLYYENCLPDLRPSTYKMGAGVRAHQNERKEAARRTYGLPEGEHHFNLTLTSEALGLIGEIDEVILTPDEAFVVDYKLAKKVGNNFKLQVVAYAMLLMESWNVSVRESFVYLIPTRKLQPVKVTSQIQAKVRQAVEHMHRIVEQEEMPPPPPNTRQCITCKHRRFCNDV